jgi:hypothetical protein
MRPSDVIPGPGDPNQQPVTPGPQTQPEPLTQPEPQVPITPVTPQEVPGEPKHFPIHREIPQQPIHEGGIK